MLLTGEAASPEHVLSDAFRVTHFEGRQLVYGLEMKENREVGSQVPPARGMAIIR